MAMAYDDEPMVPRDTFAARLVLIRHEIGKEEQGKELAIRDLAERCGIKHATWSLWERGAMPHDQVAVCQKIADATGYDFDWLLRGGLTLRRKLMLTTPPSGQLTFDDALDIREHEPARLLVVR